MAEEVAKWQAEYGPRGLEVIAVHQPRGPEELDLAKVTQDAKEAMKISWPLAIDNEHTLVGRFENQFVPAYYVFDGDGKLVHRQAGDRGFERLHDKIGALLGAPAGRPAPSRGPWLAPRAPMPYTLGVVRPASAGRASPRARVAELVDALA